MQPDFAFHILSQGKTVTVAASTTSASGDISKATAGPGNALRVYNSSAGIAFLRFEKDGAATATSADLPVAPGATEVFYIPKEVNVVAVLLSTGTGNVYLTRGEGM